MQLDWSLNKKGFNSTTLAILPLKIKKMTHNESSFIQKVNFVLDRGFGNAKWQLPQGGEEEIKHRDRGT